ncbi:lysylphosphatidylglycerol synthase transmembrane domain-containing protein [Enterococcus bulliens]
MKKTTIKLILNSVFLCLILAILVYLVRQSFASIVEELLHTKLALVIGLIVLGLAYQLIEGVLIKQIIRRPHFSVVDGIFTSLYVAFYRVVTFGAGTFISEVAFYHKKKISYSESVGLAMFRLMLYKLTLVVYAVFSLLLFGSILYTTQSKAFWFVLLGSIMTLSIVALLLLLTFSQTIQAWNTKLAKQILRKPKWIQKIDEFNAQVDALRQTVKILLLTPRVFFQLLLISLVKLATWYLIPVLYLYFNPNDVSFFFVFGAISFAVILAGVLPAPAGIGSFEFVYLFMFQPLFGTVETASSLVLYRFATYVLPFLLGAVYVFWDKQRTLKQEFKEMRQKE